MKTISAQQGIKITFIGIIINIILVFIKLTCGVIGYSRALIADAIHSLSDVSTDIVVIIGLYYSNQPPDESHHFGHQKIETLVTILIGIFLIIVAIKLGLDSAKAIYFHTEIRPEKVAIIAVLFSLIAKELLYRYTIIVAKKINNQSLIANAWHHRSDSLSSLAVFIGLILAHFYQPLQIVDTYLGLLISFIILKFGLTISWEAINKIADIAPPKAYTQKIKQLMSDYDGVKDVHNLRIRYLGSLLKMEVHIRVDPELTVRESHTLATNLEQYLKRYDKNIIGVLIHIEPTEE